MKILSPLACLSVAAQALTISRPPGQKALLSGTDDSLDQRYLIELRPGETEWVTEDEKWELRREGINFMDITDTQDLGASILHKAATVKYPKKPAYNVTIRPLLNEIKESKMKENLEVFTAFHTRFYKSESGAESSNWLLKRVNDTVSASGAYEYGAMVEAFHHPWGQSSIIAHFPGQSNKTIVIGAHQDSINAFMPWLLAAPGADDDGSGTVTILEALRVLLQSKEFIQGKAENTVEFHWYSAEEGGLLGSQAIFSAYRREGRDVKAMLQQDMTGYVQRTLDAGEPESVGVITDFVSPELTAFILEAITEYCDIPYVLTKCGYACSDHASASKAGYPSAFVIESDFKYVDTHIHTSEDKIEYLSFQHMKQHARLTLGLVYELAFAKFD